MNEFVVALETVRHSDGARVGAKASVLGALLDAGYPVPPGICLTTDAFRLALKARWSEINVIIRDGDLRDPEGAVSAANAIAELLADLRVPASVSAALHEALPSIASQSSWLAVRSSATAEDGADASLAGQYSSVLGARGDDAVESAVVAVWRSFFNASALVACATSDRLENEAMAVLIQPLIDAECAGVCFSVDPVRQRRDLIVINAAWGLAAGVVDGSVASDTTWIRRDGFECEGSAVEKQHVAEKSEQIALAPEGGLRRVPVSEERQRAACLPEPWLRRIGQFGVAAELFFGCPQDLEWAIADGRVWVLQSRPITALSRELAQTPCFPVQWEHEQDCRHFWTLRELTGQESDILPPLEQDHQSHVESMREETCRFMGVDKNGRLAFFNGRAYFCQLPLDLAQGDVRVRRAAMVDLKERLQRQGLTAWDYWGPEAVRATERLDAFDRKTAGGSQLAEHLEDALAVRRRHYMLHPLCWFNPPQSFFDAFERVSGLTGEAAQTAAYHLLDGEETPLTRLLDGLYALACTARQAPAVAALIVDSPSDVLERLTRLPDAAAFRAQLDDFLSVYGAHNGDGWGSEATVLTPTWLEQPEQVLRLVAPYLNPIVDSPAIARARAQQARDAEIESLCEVCTDQEAVAEFRRELAYARKVRTVLEYHNHYLNQLSIGQLRRAVLAAADWLVAHGALTDRDQVFWLRFDEILTALSIDSPRSLDPTVTARQAQHAEWAESEPPPLLGVPETRLPDRPPMKADVTENASLAEETTIMGLGASPGLYNGRARVVAATIELPELSPGDVLVAENVGPRWTPLFPILGGLVLDGGSFGQHAASAAREYGVPAVIGTKNATRRIPDGARVLVDGTKGVVELELDLERAVSEV